MSSQDLRKILFVSYLLTLSISMIDARCFEMLIRAFQNDEQNIKFSYFDSSPIGPANWPGMCSTGKAQTPIIYDAVMPISATGGSNPLRMTGAATAIPSQMVVYNSGHGATFSFTYADGSAPIITGGPLGTDEYKFVQFHSHWPCEHKPYKFWLRCDYETHFVHVNTKYATIAEALAQPDGLAVVGLMYNAILLGRSSPPYTSYVTKVVPYKAEVVETTNLFSYASAMGFTKFPQYVNYKGSLTTPDCRKFYLFFLIYLLEMLNM